MSEESKELRKKCNSAFSIIYYNIDPQLRGILDCCNDPAITWRSISDHYQPKSIAQEMQYILELFDCRPDLGESVGNFSHRINHFVGRLSSIDQPAVNKYVAFQFLKSLPDKFDSIVQTILRWDRAKFIYKNIVVEVIAEETRLRL